MRIKQRNPEKSLYEVDYTLPSVVIWFFGGQVPTKQNSTTATLTSIEVSNQKDKKVDKKLLKAGVLKTIQQYELEGDELSDTPHGNSVNNGTVNTISNGNSNSSNAIPSSTKKLVHPLSQFQEVPALTDLQVFISEAILSEEGNSCSFEKIYEYVSQRWRNIRRRDGSNYTTDCRRAIQANLRHNPNHVALFRRDNSKQGSYWTVCTTIEESLEASRDKTSERGRNKRDKEAEGSTDENNGNSDMDEDVPELPDKKDVSSSVQGKNETNPNSPLSLTSLSEAGSTNNSNGDSSNNDSHKLEQPKLTELQALVCECIDDNSGSCHFDLICMHVSKHWNTISNKNGNVDVKGAILSTLTDSKRLFKRDTKRTGWWMINSDLITDGNIGSPKIKKEEEAPTTPKPKPKTRTKIIKELQDLIPPDNISDSGSPSGIEPENAGSGDESQKQKNEPPMTELQVLIIQAIDAEGSVATFDQIYERVSKKFDSIKRRDGTPYTSECRRAIQASLSNNPTTRPFFKKETKKGTVLWSLAKRSLEFLADQKKGSTDSNPSGEIKLEESDSSNTEQKENDNDEEIVDNNDSEEMEEEIHDEEDYEDDMDKEEKETRQDVSSPKKQREEPKEDKHLFANRVKRARKIKENAGKRNQNNDYENSKGESTRLKKRRR